MQPKAVSLRKRSMIAMANRTMFLWVALVSVIFGASLVASIFLTQILIFNEKVLSEKSNTVSTLKSNNANVDDLKKNVRALSVNQALIDIKASPDDEALQVILDALPSKANSPALGASLQNKLLYGITGLELSKIQVNQVSGVETLSDEAVIDASSGATGSESEITFSFSVVGTQTELKQVLVNLEKSIRTIDVISLKIENQGDKQEMTIVGRGFYEPERVVKLIDKVVK